MSLTVLNVAYPLAPVSASTAGGAEQVLSTLDRAIVESGWQSLVVAPAGSECHGTLIPIRTPAAKLDDDERKLAWIETRRAIRSAVERFCVDVVHLHGIDFMEYLPDPGIPVVVTLHLPPSWYSESVFRINPPDINLVCVSNSQRQECPPEARIRAVVSNGTPLGQFLPVAEKQDYVFALGRICPEKGFHLAIDAAEKAGSRLLLAGTVFGYDAHREYFDTVLAPKLITPHQFLGAVGGRQKSELLARARCVVIPSLVAETSSLVAMEAMASGTPVVAFRRGALPEIIEHGRTGFLVDSVEEMADAIRATCTLDPHACRASAEANYPAQRMSDQYLDLYRRLATQAASSIGEHAA